MVVAMLVLATACGDAAGADEAAGSTAASSDEAGSTAVEEDGESTGSPMTSGAEESSETTDAWGTCTVVPTSGAKADVFVVNGATPGNVCSPDPAPCGDDATGEWTLAESCGYDLAPLPNPFAQSCPGGDFTADEPVRTGSLLVAPDGTFELTMSTTLGYHFVADITCLGLFDCPQAAGVLAQQGGNAVCEGDAFACFCTFTTTRDAVHRTGTIVLPHATALVDDAGEPVPYCRSGERMGVWTIGGASTPGTQSCSSDGECSAGPDELGLCMPA